MVTYIYICIGIQTIALCLIAINLFFFNSMKRTIDAIADVFVPGE
jgi:hypothetical protein